VSPLIMLVEGWSRAVAIPVGCQASILAGMQKV